MDGRFAESVAGQSRQASHATVAPCPAQELPIFRVASLAKGTRADRLFVREIQWSNHQVWRKAAKTAFHDFSNVFDQTVLLLLW